MKQDKTINWDVDINDPDFDPTIKETTPSIPVQNIVYIKGKKYDATENSVCYDLIWRQIHEDQNEDKYILIDRLSGKSDFIYLDQPNPVPSIPVKDEGNVTGEAVRAAYNYLLSMGYFTSPTDEGRRVENLLIQARCQEIDVTTAINSTYGKGYNPAAMEQLYQALEGLCKQIHLGKLNIRKDFSLINAHAYANKVLHNAKIITSSQPSLYDEQDHTFDERFKPD